MSERIPIEALNAEAIERQKQQKDELSELVKALMEPMPEHPIRAILKRLARARELAVALTMQLARELTLAELLEWQAQLEKVVEQS